MPPIIKTRTHDFSRCPRCKSSMEPAIAFNQGISDRWLTCTNPKCNTYINTYIPQPHQMAVHRDHHLIIGNFGGYGSGKTTNSQQENYKHFFLTPNGNAIITANIAPQYEQTIKRDIEADIPQDFVKSYNTQKQYMDFVNGCRLMYRPLDDPDKLRSLNVSHVTILEASETGVESYTQLTTRLRNTAALILHPDSDPTDPFNITTPPIADWRKMIIESNPDSGWIRTDVVMVAGAVHQHGGIVEEVPRYSKESEVFGTDSKGIDSNISVHITATNANKHLPPNFEESLARNKPLWWVSRYLRGSFSYAVGLVYPRALEFVMPTLPVPRHWKRLIAFDYGLSDDAVFLFAAVDPDSGLLIVYKELRTKNNDIKELAALFNLGARDIPTGALYTMPLIDPKSGVKRDYNKKTLIDLFNDEGIMFKPGHVSVDARVFRLNTYIEAERVRIMSHCTALIEELRNYKWKVSKDKNSSNGFSDKPEDKKNHGINALEWICMELPSDPDKLTLEVYNRYGQSSEEFEKRRQKEYGFHALESADYNTRTPHYQYMGGILNE